MTGIFGLLLGLYVVDAMIPRNKPKKRKSSDSVFTDDDPFGW